MGLAWLLVSLCAFEGGRVLAACAAWLMIMSLLAPQKMAWHAISLVPLFALAPAVQGKERTLWLLGILAFIELCAQLFFGASLMPGWFEPLFARL